MAYKPQVASSGVSGDRGRAKVLVNKTNPNQILVRMKAQTWNAAAKEWNYEDKEFKVLRSDCPDNVKDIIKSTDNAYIQMSGDGKKVYKFSPWQGMYTGKFVGFVASKDEPPAPKTYNGKDWSYQYMVALIEILDEPFKGSTVAYMLRYHFAEIVDDGKSLVGYSHGKSKYTEQLMEFLDVVGVWEKGAMQYKDNVLPTIQKRALAENRKFKFVVKDGNINTIFGVEEPTQETVEEDSE